MITGSLARSAAPRAWHYCGGRQRGLAKKRHCTCDAGDADLKAAQLGDPSVARFFTFAGLTP